MTTTGHRKDVFFYQENTRYKMDEQGAATITSDFLKRSIKTSKAFLVYMNE